MKSHRYIACDLGAESGRVVLGTLHEGILHLDEVHRFANGPVSVDGSLRWDVVRIFDDIKTGLALVAARLESGDPAFGSDVSVDGLSVDSWGVDYVLTRNGTTPIALPYHYRDPRTEAAYMDALNIVSAETIFSQTGIQFMPINTLYQLLAHRRQEPDQLAEAEQVLLIADYFNALLAGIACAERSLASTTQLYNPKTGCWSNELLERYDLPGSLLPRIVDSGTILGPLLSDIAAETGLHDVQVIATCSHDTAAAVAAVPIREGDGDDTWAYLSSGTWSLLGMELSSPLIDAQAQAANFTNEAGYNGSTRFLKNLAGLWIIQECRRAWLADGKQYTYDALAQLAEASSPFRSLIRPNASRFQAHGDMPSMIAAFCRETNQIAPETPGQFIRCILESLALCYRETLEQLQRLTNRKVDRLHICGGGSQNILLNQFAANATRRTVLAGPVEATAIGNLLLQAVTLGHLDGIAALRETVRASFPISSFTPADAHSPEARSWENAYSCYQRLEITN